MAAAFTDRLPLVVDYVVELTSLPDWVLSLLLILGAVLLALLLYQLLAAIVRRALGLAHPFLQSLIARTRAPARAAFIVVAIALAVSAAPLPPHTAALVNHLLLISVIILGGWLLRAAIVLASDLYLRRVEGVGADSLLARKHVTQISILRRAAEVMLIILTAAFVLMTFETVRQFGVTLFASAGIAGLIAGLAARPVLTNLFAGIQIALTQPIRIGDNVNLENESGTIEEITSTYVVVRLWDLRRLVLPIAYFIEKPFQNLSRESTETLGTVLIHADYGVPVARVREKLLEIVRASPHWDGKTVKLEMVEATDRAVQLRALVSSATPAANWELRCDIRERLVAFLQEECPDALPRGRADIAMMPPQSS